MHSLASPLWQEVFFIGAGLYLLWEAWRGWRRGVVRSAIYFIAFVLSGFVGFAVGQGVYTLMEKTLPGTAFVTALATGAAATIIILLLCVLLGALLFKRTAQQSSAFVRLFFGAGGSLFGLLTGLAILWGGISLVRVAGTMAESAIVAHPGAEAPSLLLNAATLKESIELGPAGKIVESVDAMPPEAYRMITQITKLTNDQAAMMRLLDYPGVQEIIQNPRVVRLLQDPATLRSSQNRNISDLIMNKAVIEAANDPELAKLLKKFDLQKALDYAVPSAEASPTPKKKKP